MLHNYNTFQNLCTKFQTILFSENFDKKCAQNAGNCISEALDFKIFRETIPTDPPTYAMFLINASVSPHAGSAPGSDYEYRRRKLHRRTCEELEQFFG